MKNVVDCVTILDCNYRKNVFFKVESIIVCHCNRIVIIVDVIYFFT